MSSYEQKVEAPDKEWQFLLFAAEPYETIGFKVCACVPLPRSGQDAVSMPPSCKFLNFGVVYTFEIHTSVGVA